MKRDTRIFLSHRTKFVELESKKKSDTKKMKEKKQREGEEGKKV